MNFINSVAVALALSVIGTAGFSQPAHAANHVMHPPHNMILLGSSEVFASHIVFKQPHNYQVILKIELDTQTKQIYQNSVSSHPDDLHIFLLDPLDIGQIASQTQISGKILREDTNGIRWTLVPKVAVDRANFKTIFFDELPVNLSSNPHTHP